MNVMQVINPPHLDVLVWRGIINQYNQLNYDIIAIFVSIYTKSTSTTLANFSSSFKCFISKVFKEQLVKFPYIYTLF